MIKFIAVSLLFCASAAHAVDRTTCPQERAAAIAAGNPNFDLDIMIINKPGTNLREARGRNVANGGPVGSYIVCLIDARLQELEVKHESGSGVNNPQATLMEARSDCLRQVLDSNHWYDNREREYRNSYEFEIHKLRASIKIYKTYPPCVKDSDFYQQTVRQNEANLKNKEEGYQRNHGYQPIPPGQDDCRSANPYIPKNTCQ